MGEVYRARDTRLNRVVALKFLPAAATNDTERRERFEREAQAVAASTTDGVQSLWIVSIDGGAPVRVTNRFVTSPILSPDGKSVAFGTRDDQDRPGYAICDLPDCSSPRSVPARPDGGRQRIDWTADGRGFLYVAGTPQNLWVESLDGKPPRQLTHFTDNRQIADVAWSRDRKRLAIARTTQTSDIVLFTGLKR